MKRLVVNADDLGLSVPITDGILEAHARGIVTSTSIMVNGAAFEYAVAQSRQHPSLGIGLHLSLVEEPWLTTRTPMARDYAEFAKALIKGTIREEQVEQELRAQLARCVEQGLRLTHIDSHQHVHALPALLKIVVKVAKEAGIPRVRVPLDSPFRSGAIGSSRFLGKTVLCLLSIPAQGAVKAAGLKSCDRMVGLFESGSLTEAKLLRLIEHLEEGSTELMCHPGHTDAKYAHWNFQWKDELQALTSPTVRAALQSRGVQLSSS
jgi:predicted glycoside hydrolase/deacetylase ChbG (UPF0249 family)